LGVGKGSGRDAVVVSSLGLDVFAAALSGLRAHGEKLLSKLLIARQG
jgi:hypothetical protein